MELFIAYLIESSIILGILTVFYRFFLHKETLFKFNRFYLLSSVVLATIIPFVSFSFATPSADTNVGEFGYMLASVNVYSNQVRDIVVPVVVKNSLFAYLYAIGAIVLVLRLGLAFVRLGGLSQKASWSKENGVRVAHLPGHFNPFSFFKIIFVNQTLYSSSDLEKIMIHEKAHVQLKHSVDVMLFELLLIVQWFNPFVWFTKYLLKELHEFQADSTVLKAGIHIGEYKMLLLNQAVGARLLPVNNLNQSITKRRFMMMTNKTFKNMVALKSIMAVCVLLSIALFFACSNDNLSSEEADVKLKSTEGVDELDPVFFIVEQMPQYPGGELELRKHLATSVKYPAEAIEKGIQGRVYVQFVIGSDGDIRDIEVARGVHELLDKEAVRVVESFEKWEPGMQKGKPVSVSYTVPINFVLRDGYGRIMIQSPNLGGGESTPTVFVDGEKVSMEEFSKIPKEKIAKMDIIKGEDAKSGVLQVTLK